MGHREPNSRIPSLAGSLRAMKSGANDLAAQGQMLSAPLDPCTSSPHRPTRGAAAPRPVPDRPFLGGAGRALTF